MMERRLELHEELCRLLGSRNVYYQPPENLKLKYPCIIYSRSPGKIKHADGAIYSMRERYSLTVIDTTIDSELYKKLVYGLKYCSFNRSYVSDGLSHDSLDVYY